MSLNVAMVRGHLRETVSYIDKVEYVTESSSTALIAISVSYARTGAC